MPQLCSAQPFLPAPVVQDEIVHEAQTMKAYNHPNVLTLFCSFVHGQDLWMVMPFVSGGSVLHIMKYAHPEVCTAQLIAEEAAGGGGRGQVASPCRLLVDWWWWCMYVLNT